RIFLAFERKRPHAEHAVFTLQDDLDAGSNVVRHQSRHADAQVHVKTVLHLARNALHDALALLHVFLLLRFVADGGSRHNQLALFLTVRFSIRLGWPVLNTIRFTYTLAKCTLSGSSCPGSTISSTSAMVTCAAVAITGLKFRDVLRNTRLPQRSAFHALISAKSAFSARSIT